MKIELLVKKNRKNILYNRLLRMSMYKLLNLIILLTQKTLKTWFHKKKQSCQLQQKLCKSQVQTWIVTRTKVLHIPLFIHIMKNFKHPQAHLYLLKWQNRLKCNNNCNNKSSSSSNNINYHKVSHWIPILQLCPMKWFISIFNNYKWLS